MLTINRIGFSGGTRLRFLLLSIFLLLLGGCASLPERVHDLESQEPIATNKLLGRIAGHRVIFVGEAHNSDADHLMQLEVIKQLHESGRKVVVGLEMFPATFQEGLDNWLRGDLSTGDFKDLYYATWKVPYGRYKPIFNYAWLRRIRLIGLNIPPEKARRLLAMGVESESQAMLRGLKYRSCSQEMAYARAMHAYWNRIHRKGEFMPMCNVRRFKEAFMAARIQSILDLPEEAVVVVLVGAIHALKNAVPEMLRRRGVDGSLILTTGGVSNLLGSEITKEQADLVW